MHDLDLVAGQGHARVHAPAARQPESGTSASSNADGHSNGEGGRGGFAKGLSALISEVSSGKAPAELQTAFDKLTSDLGSSSSDTKVNLQALLTKLLGDLGFTAGAMTTRDAI